MITRLEVMPLLLEACPDFQASWDAHLEWWGLDQPGLYNDLAAFAQFLLGALESGRTDCFARVFAAIERLLSDGEPYVQDATAAGFLEELLGGAASERVAPSRFASWLGPAARDAWAELGGGGAN